MNTNMRRSILAYLSQGTTQLISRLFPYFVTLKHIASHPEQSHTCILATVS